MKKLLNFQANIDGKDAPLLMQSIARCEYEVHKVIKNFEEVIRYRKYDPIDMNIFSALIDYGWRPKKAYEYLSSRTMEDDDKKLLTAFIDHLKDPDKVKKFVDFIKDSSSTQESLLGEIVDGSFNEIGEKRVKLIGVSIEINEKLSRKWSTKVFFPRGKLEYNLRRLDIEEKLKEINEQGNHTAKGLEDLEAHLRKIKDSSTRSHDVQEKLKNLSRQNHTQQTGPQAFEDPFSGQP